MRIDNSHVILFLITLFSLIIPAYAVDNPMYEPTCITPSYDSGYTLLTSSNNVTDGRITSRTIGSDGYFDNSNDRVTSGINILCAVSDPTTTGTLASQSRIFGTSEDGSVWYTDTSLLNYSLGFYSPGYFGCAVDGNCNPLKKIGILSATTGTRKLAIDSNGNVYTIDGYNIKKFIKSLSYSPQTIYTLTATRDFNANGYTEIKTLDIKIDSSDNIHVLVGTYRESNGGVPQFDTNLSKTVFDTSGNFITANRSLQSYQSVGGIGYKDSGFSDGGLYLDSANPNQNFTYLYNVDETEATRRDGDVYLKHNSTAGTIDINGAALGIKADGVYYNNYQLYVSSASSDLIRSYITTFAGQLPSSVGGDTPTELTYTVSTINILETSYYNNTLIDVNVNVVVDLSGQSIAEDLLNTQNLYRWKMQLNDPNGAQAAFHLSGICTEVGTSCFMNETLSISPPFTNWSSAGTYTAYLKEYNIHTYTESTLDTDTTTVLNQSGNNSGITITEPITSGTGTTALSTIDQLTGLLGFGVNPISKFVFAMILIITFMFFGYIATKYDTMGGIIAASLPFCFFVFISYIPLWTIVIVVLVIAFKGRWVG